MTGDCLKGAVLSSLRRADQRAPAWVRRGVRSLAWTNRMAHSSRSPKSWAREYESGEWERLRGLQEFGRSSLIAGYVRHLGADLRILDLGCGNGALIEELKPLGHSCVGCDLALPAVRRARESASGRDLLLVADAEALPFQPGSFDVVVCNEVLNYLADLPAVVSRLLRLLTENGHLIVSLFDAFGAEQRALWAPLKSRCEVVDMIALTRFSTGVTWRLALLAPRAAAE